MSALIVSVIVLGLLAVGRFRRYVLVEPSCNQHSPVHMYASGVASTTTPFLLV